MPSISSEKLKPRKGSMRLSVGHGRSPLSAPRLRRRACGGPQADADDDELGRLHRRDADQADQPALSMSVCVIVVRSHLTKKASSGLVPSSAPLRQTGVRKL